MTTRRMTLVSGLTLAVAGGMLACSKPAGPSADLSRDLAAASSGSSGSGSSASALTLAPTAGSQQIVSAVEQSPRAHRAPARARVQLVSHPSPVAPAPVVTPTVTPTVTSTTAPATIVATVAAVPAPVIGRATAQRPTPMQPPQHGRYKTEAEVFRDAPFPINP